MKLTDKELLNELSSRFEHQNKLIEDQKELLGELEEVNKKLLQSEKIKSDFISNIKNEINNPITSMLGLLRLVMKHPDSDKNENRINMVYREAFTLNFHLQNVFFAAEIEAGQLIPDFSKVDIKHIIENQIEILNHVYSDKNIDIILHFNLDHAFVTDRAKLDIAIVNLISNALKFSHDGDKVDIHVAEEGEQLIIKITDYGHGMEEESVRRAFDRFVQLDTGTTKQYPGHGLGLSVVQAMIELLEGDIKVESALNKGTSVTVTIPEANLRHDEDIFDDDDELLFDDDNVNVF